MTKLSCIMVRRGGIASVLKVRTVLRVPIGRRKIPAGYVGTVRIVNATALAAVTKAFANVRRI